MKKVIFYIKDYFKTEWKPGFFVLNLLLVAALVFVEYYYDFTRQHINEYFEEPEYFFIHVALYGGVFWFGILSYIYFYKRYDLLSNFRFISFAVLVILVYAFRCYFSFFRIPVEEWAQVHDPGYTYYWRKCAFQVGFGTLLFVPGIIMYFIYNRNDGTWYGFNTKQTNLKIYWLMLLCMVPLIAWASTQKDFLLMYPQFNRFMGNPAMEASERIWRIGFFELVYSYDFMMNEFFFRGLIILGLARFMGKGVILPMAVFYVTIHFGKPLGETISSLLGGTILGIIAYETRSIYGGIIIHIGIAMLMELGGFIGGMFIR